MSRDLAFPFPEFEPKWQDKWQEAQCFKAEESDKPKYYILDMFPYPSGSGLHVGHPEGYTATDILARYKRMQGMNVLHPMGWDAFGLPAEQYAIQTGTHPKITTQANVNNFRKQIKRLGFSYDWDREVDTTHPEYFRWTQWIFLQLFNKGLAYEKNAPVWWCEALGCVLANEEVVDGKSERGQHPVERKPMRQWMLKITAYADRLLEGLDDLDWPKAVKDMQRNWIGKSIGAEVDFGLDVGGERRKLRVFTTRPDTLFGATYMVLSPEHAWVKDITTEEQRQAVVHYQEAATKKSELERTQLEKEKTGVFTGAFAKNLVNEKLIPIWIADYVLASYGTGAIMAVPAHDQRDFEFAKKYDIEIIPVIHAEKSEPNTEAPVTDVFSANGINFQSDFLNGLKTPEAKKKMIAWLVEKQCGEEAVNFKLRDWLFSRQRYWGEPIPVVHCKTCGHVPLDESALPLTLPEIKDFKPSSTGEPPLANAKEWIQTSCPKCQGPATRETNTMPQWAGSCWYYLRYLDPTNMEAMVGADKEKYWMNVDLYVGGAEHAVLHLLYARFWHKVLYDLGHVSTQEPFQKLVNQGIILGEDGQKMSKSRGNVINPDVVIDEYGADSMRLFEMFMGPLEQSKAWAMTGVQGVHRFLARVWRLYVDENGEVRGDIVQDAPDKNQLRLLHQVIERTTRDLDRMQFNTAISGFMIFVNECSKLKQKSREVMDTFLKLLSPFAPHMAEEIWAKLGGKGLICQETWPKHNAKYLVQNTVEIPIQVNGKIKERITVDMSLDKEGLEAAALAAPKVVEAIAGKTIRKVIVVPKRLVNLVV